MRNLLYILLGIGLLGCKNKTDQPYRISEKDSANFTVALSMLFPNEHLLVKVNNEVVLDTIGEVSASLGSLLYFKYPKKINTISASGVYNGHKTFNRIFKDTLTYSFKRVLIIPFPMPKNLLKENHKPEPNVPVEGTERLIQLHEDNMDPKGTSLL